ncbi:hypothetical protein GCK72_009212 [Caenorhabditis remanei]|uniref:F-box domain-containing protein n=1 Tax=Caenorhabditis remanei TaxID=31234 RepID=A0A6A5H1V6_CAERE|nr:hypothetical protein GCK72_009212 [Caenorhabditis remanei]KAF1760959.1 hypothetical protein GCK72_009212 [Caenorhabditis remanei]
MEQTFPLFRLPENAILEVIKYWWINPLFEFSLISTKTKNIVASLGIEADDVRIVISRDVKITVSWRYIVLSLRFYKHSVDARIHLNPNQPIPAYFANYYNWTIQSSSPFSFNNWLDHIKTVFCYHKPPNVAFLPGNERFEIESLKNTFKNVNQLVLTEHHNEFRNRELLEIFKNANELSLARNPFEEACEVQKIFIQNSNDLGFFDDVSLDDMLLVNSERVAFSRPISQKQFNQFLKHWIHGSNPRLQYMVLSIAKIDFVSGEVDLKGIECMEMNEWSMEEIRQKHEIPDFDMVQIRRKDGTTAVIATKESSTSISVRFYVSY